MLKQLTVNNFALLKHVDLSFDGHFNVLTGETGAGKSIIIDAVKLVLGERANVSDIRVGEDQASVEAVFEMRQGHPVFAVLDALGLEHDGESVVLTRQIRANGKNVCRINRQVVTLSQFKEICAPLISIYGQHDYDELGDAKARLRILDGPADSAHRTLMQEVAAAYERAQKSGRTLKRALRKKKELEREAAQLKEKVEELSPLALKKGEEEELQERYKMAAHAQDLYDAAYYATAALYESQEGVHTMLTDVIQKLKSVAQYDEGLNAYVRDLENARIVVDDAARDLSDYRERMDVNPAALEEMSARLALFSRLKRKYQMDIDALVDALEIWQRELAQAENMDEEIADLQKTYQKDRSDYTALAAKLHESRLALAEDFCARLTAEISDMAMPDVRFEVALSPFAGDDTGMDVCDFLIAPNPGMPLLPLAEIASGGEMSRIMLAIKTIESGAGDVETLIFDEIDTGIGGMVLTTVADKLETLSQHEQVICVTHAASIAARGDKNFFIEKESTSGLTETHVRPLRTEAEVVDEVARMSGGRANWQLEAAARWRAQKRYKDTVTTE